MDDSINVSRNYDDNKIDLKVSKKIKCNDQKTTTESYKDTKTDDCCNPISYDKKEKLGNKKTKDLTKQEMMLISEYITLLSQERSSKAAVLVDICGNKYSARDNYWPFRLREFSDRINDHTNFLNPLSTSKSFVGENWAPRLRGGADADNQGNQVQPGMVDIAIKNAARHGIRLHHGVPNLGNGNCIFESVIDNINTRQCFAESLNGDPDTFRRVWLDETEELVFRFTGGLGKSEESFRKNWNILKCSRGYEYDLGDFVLPAVAHCTRKDILIFNTNVAGNMDPLYVVQASTLGGSPANTDIPILLAYNSVHYEGLVPNSEEDIIKTIKLKNDYTNGRYNVSNRELPIVQNEITDEAILKSTNGNLAQKEIFDINKGNENMEIRLNILRKLGKNRSTEQGKEYKRLMEKKRWNKLSAEAKQLKVIQSNSSRQLRRSRMSDEEQNRKSKLECNKHGKINQG